MTNEQAPSADNRIAAAAASAELARRRRDEVSRNRKCSSLLTPKPAS